MPLDAVGIKHSLHWKLGVILDENHSKKQKIKFHKKYIHY